MSSNYPGTLDSFTDPLATNFLNSPSHSAIEQAQNAALAALEATVGTTGSAVATSVFYKLTNPLSLDPGHLHTLTAQVGTFPTSRLTGTFPASGISGTFPASSLSGVVSTANLPVGTNAGQILVFPANNILPAVNASALTNLPTPTISGILGSWGGATTMSAQQVSTDGFLVLAGVGNSSNSPGTVILKSDSSNPPTTVRANFGAGGNTGPVYSLMIPVKKNDYYLVTITGTGAVTNAYFIPLGT